MTKPNKDRELLRKCLLAFEALPNAEPSRNLLRLMCGPVGHLHAPAVSLAGLMAGMIKEHLGDGFDDTRQQLEELGKASGGSHRQYIGD